MERVINALSKSWEHDHIAFISEMIGVMFTIIASLTLALTAKSPDMPVIFAIYEIGSIALLYAYYRREMVWSILLAIYFVVINVVGFIIAI